MPTPPLDPSLSEIGAETYTEMEPVSTEDVDNGYALQVYCYSVGTMFDQTADLVRPDDPNGVAWEKALNPSECPSYALPWLGQFVGVLLEGRGLTDAQMRQMITQHGMWQRGTPAYIIATVQATLSGSKSCYLNERLGGDAYAYEVVVDPSCITNMTATQHAVRISKPAGLNALLNTSGTGLNTYDRLKATYNTYDDIPSQTYDSLKAG
jgi:hypothetical protein